MNHKAAAALLQQAGGPDSDEILDAMPLGVFVKDAQSRLVRMNPACERQWGVTFEEVRGTDGRIFAPPEDVDRYRAKDREVLAAGRAVEFEETVWNPELGQHRILRVMKTPVCGASGDPRYLLGMMLDITDHAGSETEYRAILRTTLDAFWVNDLSGRFLDANDAYCRMLGYRRDELLRMGIADVEAVETPPDIRAHIAKLVSEGFDRFESRHRRKDGSLVDLDISCTYFPVGGGRLFVFARDISGRVHAAQAARQAAQRFETLASATFEGILISMDGVIVDANDQLLALLGYERRELIGRRIRDLLPAAELTRVMSGIEAGLDTHIEHQALRKDGTRCHVEARGRTLVQEGHRLRLTAIRDITERKAAEQAIRASKLEAERANDAKSRFLAAVSHDLRQPLSALSLYVGALEGKLGEADRDLLDNMKNCVGGLNEMLSKLLNLSRLEAGAIAPKVHDFPLSAALSRVIAAQQPRARAKRLQLRCPYPDVIGRTDPVLFQRILGNLVSNAIRYTDRGGVLVGCRRRGGKRWVEVWDTGIGIPPDKTGEIFAEFKQLGTERGHRMTGTGLGLAIVAKTAELLGLEVRVRSVPGKGSLFAVELPLGRHVDKGAEPRPPCQPLRIAIVEDDALVAAALNYSLEQCGHRLVAAASAAELIPLLEGEAPDLVISDYRLNGTETGIGVVSAVRARFGGDVPAIIVTGDTEPSLARLMAQHAAQLLYKPLDIDALQGAIAQALGLDAGATRASARPA
ncbi:MAG: PAS domain S-box protein [Ignavibacteria bacterium]